MDNKRIIFLMEEAIDVNQELFLIDYTISNNGDIEVVVDGDHGVSLDECVRISRHIEHNLDREEEDFSLSVTTPDITKSLVHPRQYKKNIGRLLKVETEKERFEGKLIAYDDKKIVLEWKTREPKPIGKGKHTVIKQAEIAIKDIRKAIVKIIFN
jgi:ribosome maturation factor RimP